MSIARFSVTRPVAVSMRIASLVLLGFICLMKLPIDLLPRVSLPTVAVVTQWPNVAPEEIETQITRPIEQAVSSASNIYQVSSTSTQGVSVVRVQFNYGTDVGQAAVDVLQQVERARQAFPNDPTLQTPLVYRFDPSQLPILIFGVSGEQDLARLKAELNNQVAPILQSAGGVASAVATGGLDRAIIVDVDPNKLQSYHLSLAEVSRRIAQENLELPAGIARRGETEYTIRSVGFLRSPQELAAIPVGSYNGQLVSIGQVATVRDSHQEQRVYTRLNGQPAVGMTIVKQSAANTVDTARNVFAKLEQVQKLYPNLKWGVAYDQSQFVVNSIADVRNSALIGGLLAILILLLFLRNFRSTLVVALSIPISIISTFTLLYLCGFTLNTLSLSGLSLATGLIVDDAVVVLENIFRHIERDRKRPAEAAVTGTNEISSAVVASTLTVMVVFLPLFLIQGLAGQMFTQFALVVVFSIAISLLDALTVVPMLASRLIKEEEVEAEAEEYQHQIRAGENGDRPPETDAARKKRGPMTWLFDWFGERYYALDRSYHRGLGWALQHRAWVIIGALAAVGATFLIATQIGTEMLPQSDSGNFNVTLRLPVGTALDETDAVMQRAEQIVGQNPDVQTVFAAAGSGLSLRGTTTSLTPYQGSMTVRLKDNRKHSTQEVMRSIQRQLGQLAGARVVVTPIDIVAQLISGGNLNVEVDIYGSDLPTLAGLSRDVLSQVRNIIPGMENADVNVQEATPELQFQVDRQKALEQGVSFADIATTINAATNGTLSSYYQEGGFQYPIYVQLPEATRKDIDQILNIPISSGTGGSTGTSGTAGAGSAAGSAPTATAAGGNNYVLLRVVAQPSVQQGPNEILRQNSQRYIGITAVTQGRPQSQILADLRKLLSRYRFPPGYYWDFGLTQRQQSEEFAGLGLAVGMAIALIYMLLASQFESFIHPLTILVSVPLSSLGVALALFLTGRSFGLTAFIGLLLLIGIVVKNGILLIDYTNHLRARGLERDEAVLTASPTRMRPILMTASAAALGMLPLALGIGKGSETQAPLATAVIGGLTTSTLLTLFVVPVVYTLFDDLGRFLRREKRDLAAPTLIPPSVEAVDRAPMRPRAR
ncbi:MAG TPA: efflux RND transporter permease subunit [Chthonomonadaceae bacterium]|nr:efflux RND transporter permease subunit [Chthonomonadaceae bacterium]